MFRRSFLTLGLLLAAASAIQAQANFLSEGFDSVPALAGAGWFIINHSSPVGTTTWFQGRSADFPAQSGAATAYAAADFDATTGGTGTISDWLLTPQLNLGTQSTLRFWTRTHTSVLFPDRMQVRLSTAGASTNVGTTATDLGDFTQLLLDINPTYAGEGAGYPQAWTEFVLSIPSQGGGASGRLAFRYFVENGGPSGVNSDYIGVDTFNFQVIPEPTTWALIGLGVGAYPAYRTWKRRRAALTEEPAEAADEEEEPDNALADAASGENDA